MTTNERLQKWYMSQCDGDWEHCYGIHLSTLDNPGWDLVIDLLETPLEGRDFPSIKVDRTDKDWLRASRDVSKIAIFGGPGNLEEAISLFCDWAEGKELRGYEVWHVGVD